MRKVELFINDELVDVDYNEGLGVYSLEMENIRQPLSIKNEKSVQINLPRTQKNDRIFNHINRLDRIIDNKINPSKKSSFRILINGEFFREGYVKINKVSVDTYDISLFGKLGEFFEDLDAIKMQDLLFDTSNNSTLEHFIDKEFIDLNWKKACGFSGTYLDKNSNDIHNIVRYVPTMQGQYKDFSSDSVDTGDKELKKLDYPLDEFGAKEFRSYKQKPSIRVNKIVQAIQRGLSDNGSKYSFTSDFFDNNNPYYADSLFLMQSYQDRTKEGGTSKAYITKNDAYIYQNGVAKDAYVTLVANDDNVDNVVQNGKYNFENYINAETSDAIIVDMEIDFDFGGSISFDTFARPVNKYDRRLEFKLTPDQGNVTSGVISLNIENFYSDTELFLIQPANDPLSHLCRAMSVEELSFVINPDWSNGNLDAPVLNPDYDGRYGTIYWWMFKPYSSIVRAVTDFEFIPLKNTTQKGSLRFNYSTSQSNTTKDREWRMWDAFSFGSVSRNLNNIVVRTVNGNSNLTFKTTIATNTKISTKQLFPADMTAKTWLLEYTRLFGLYYEVDQYSGLVNLKTRTNFYKGNEELEWDKYFCQDKSYELNPITFDNKYLTFSFKDGNNSEYTKRYKNIYDEQYGSQLIDTGYEFTDSTEEVLKSSIFSPIAMVEQFALPNFSGITLPCVFEYSGKDRKAVDLQNCFLFVDNTEHALSTTEPFYISDDTPLMQQENDICWNMTPVASGYRKSLTKKGDSFVIPKYSTFSDKFQSTWDIARPKSIWSGQKESNYPKEYAMFPKFHQNWIGDRYSVNTKKFVGYFKLPLTTLLNFKFGNFIRFNGVLWTVENIDIDLLSTEPTKVTLISVQDKLNYTAGQDMSVGYIMFPKRTIYVNPAGEDLSLKIYSNIEWEVTEFSKDEYAQYLTFYNENGHGEDALNVNVVRNNSKTARNMRVGVVDTQNYGGNGIIDEVLLVQLPYELPHLVDTQKEIYVDNTAQYVKIPYKISENCEIDAITTTGSAQRVTHTVNPNGFSELIIKLPNENTSSNSNVVYRVNFELKDYSNGKNTDTVTIYQAPNPKYVTITSPSDLNSGSLLIPATEKVVNVKYDTNLETVFVDLKTTNATISGEYNNMFTVTFDKYNHSFTDNVDVEMSLTSGTFKKDLLIRQARCAYVLNFDFSLPTEVDYKEHSYYLDMDTNDDALTFVYSGSIRAKLIESKLISEKTNLQRRRYLVTIPKNTTGLEMNHVFRIVPSLSGVAPTTYNIKQGKVAMMMETNYLGKAEVDANAYTAPLEVLTNDNDHVVTTNNANASVKLVGKETYNSAIDLYKYKYEVLIPINTSFTTPKITEITVKPSVLALTSTIYSVYQDPLRRKVILERQGGVKIGPSAYTDTFYLDTNLPLSNINFTTVNIKDYSLQKQYKLNVDNLTRYEYTYSIGANTEWIANTDNPKFRTCRVTATYDPYSVTSTFHVNQDKNIVSISIVDKSIVPSTMVNDDYKFTIFVDTNYYNNGNGVAQATIYSPLSTTNNKRVYLYERGTEKLSNGLVRIEYELSINYDNDVINGTGTLPKYYQVHLYPTFTYNAANGYGYGGDTFTFTITK